MFNMNKQFFFLLMFHLTGGLLWFIDIALWISFFGGVFALALYVTNISIGFQIRSFS